MNNTFLILRHELLTTLGRRSFQYAAFGLPLAAMLIFGAIPLLRSRSAPPTAVIPRTSAEAEVLAEGYVDASGLIIELPPSIQTGALLAFPNEAAALLAIESGQINTYYLIPDDYLSSGQITAVRADFNPLAAFGQASAIQQALRYNLLGGDERLVARLDNPLTVQVTLLQTEEVRDEDDPLTFFLPYSATLLFYIAILTSSSLLLSSVNKDKENRMLEVLLLSTPPRQLLAGKILGLGIAGLIQTAFWIGTAFILLRLRGTQIPFLADHPLTIELLVISLIFFVLGYALYASLMASIGALVPNLREASQLSFFLVVPMLLPLMLINLIIREPNGWVSTALSLFPLTAPVTMVARLVSGAVPAWQVLLSAILIILTTWLVLRVAARLFQAQVLLSGQSFSLGRLGAALRHAEPPA